MRYWDGTQWTISAEEYRHHHSGSETDPSGGEATQPTWTVPNTDANASTLPGSRTGWIIGGAVVGGMLFLSLLGSCQPQTVGDVLKAQQAERQKDLDVAIEYCAVGSDTGVTVTNKSETLYDLTITVGYYDWEGVQIGENIIIMTVPAGRTATEFDLLTAPPVNTETCEIIDMYVSE